MNNKLLPAIVMIVTGLILINPPLSFLGLVSTLAISYGFFLVALWLCEKESERLEESLVYGTDITGSEVIIDVENEKITYDIERSKDLMNTEKFMNYLLDNGLSEWDKFEELSENFVLYENEGEE